MILRNYNKEDGDLICSWIQDETELYRWSADRFNKYPLTGDDINESYIPQIASGKFFALMAEDDGKTVGHFIIRYPKEDDDTSVRFGFIILNPEYRGKGYGKKMLLQGIEYVKKNLTASRVDLGVFANNEKAKYCYQAAGFREYQRRNCEMPIGTWECIDMEIMIRKSR